MKTNETQTVTTEVTTEQPLTLTRSLLPQFPTVVSPTDITVKYGEAVMAFPLDDKGGIGRIDSALLSGKGTKRLLNIKQALKIAGKVNDTDGRKWFNAEVRDVWHKVLKFAARDALQNGKPVSLGLSIRRNKKTGAETLTSKHGFEHVLKAGNVKQIANKAATKPAAKAPKAPKAPRIRPLTSVGDAVNGTPQAAKSEAAPATEKVAA